jgi:RNA polymerase sigma-70 factor, ECF subfamily
MKVRPGPGHPPVEGLPSAQVPDVSQPDAELARLAAAGDAAAFRALYEAHFDFVLRTCRRMGLPEHDAEDAAQEVFLVAHRKLRSFAQGKLSTWLFRIASNVVSARHRRKRVRDTLSALWLRPDDREAAPADAGLHAREAARRVGDVLARLSPKKREVFALYELEGLQGEEIAALVGCSLPTVWTRLHYARRDFMRIARERGMTE